MQKLLLVKYGELWLKSRHVRRHFEKKLKENIKKHLKKMQKTAVVKTSNGRLFICPLKKFSSRFFSHTFGIVSYADAAETGKNIEEIKKAAEIFAKKWLAGGRSQSTCTFKIKARRADKSFPLRSQEIQRVVGMHLEEKGWQADLQNPRHLIKIEIRGNAYVYAGEREGPGGLPLGTGGTAAARLRDSGDAAAAWLVMKRGTECIFIRPKKSLLKAMEKWSIGRRMRTAASLKEAGKHARVLVDCRENGNISAGFIVLNPLAGFGSTEKKALVKRIMKS